MIAPVLEEWLCITAEVVLFFYNIFIVRKVKHGGEAMDIGLRGIAEALERLSSREYHYL